MIRITISPAEESDCEFAFDVKRQALGPYVAAQWGWDDAGQRQFHLGRWRERPWSIIMFEGQKVGTVSVTRTATDFQFDEFYLLPAFHRMGIGTEVLRSVLQDADAHKVPIRLKYLKNNPVGSLYKRHGFAVTAENQTHYFLVRAAQEVGV